MTYPSIIHLNRLKLFFALSRTPHGLLDMATPAFAALIWLGRFPPVGVILLGMLTAFAGYTAVYALNDIIDYRVDRDRIKSDGFDASDNYLDNAMVRHPMAQGLLSIKEGLIWAGFWSVVAMIGAYILNPVCLLIFVSGCTLEIVYCMMWRVSPLRTLVSGAVKTSGAMAAVFAVDPSPSPVFLAVLFFCLFFWEIGGQNIPADWTDIEIDTKFNAKTIPVRLGPDLSAYIVINCIVAALILHVLLFFLSKAYFELIYVILSLCMGGYLLLVPAVKLYKRRDRAYAMSFFNKSSYFPAALFFVVLIKVIM